MDEFEKDDNFGNIYFVIYTQNKTALTVVDLSPSARHERSEFPTVNDQDFYDRDEATDHARSLSEKYSLEYAPFESRYDNRLNEPAADQLAL